jgi:tRNA threonylcarbamoyladenosine biosynthesis protein TsaE
MVGKYISDSETNTRLLGTQFAGILKRGDVIALYGELGTGKTQFIKGICKGLGIEEEITSPTFTIMNIYKNDYIIYHFDFYRLSSENEVYDLGINEFLFSDGISLIEWAEKGQVFLPKTRYEIRFDYGEDENVRLIRIIKI